MDMYLKEKEKEKASSKENEESYDLNGGSSKRNGTSKRRFRPSNKEPTAGMKKYQ